MKYAQYFLIAAISNALMQTKQPQTAWEWWIFIGSCALQGIVATKALQSNPAAGSAPEKVEIVNAKANPVKTKEVAK